MFHAPGRSGRSKPLGEAGNWMRLLKPSWELWPTRNALTITGPTVTPGAWRVMWANLVAAGSVIAPAEAGVAIRPLETETEIGFGSLGERVVLDSGGLATTK
jgi:hypothetical protein